MSLNMTSVLIADEVDIKCSELLKSHGISVTVKTKMSNSELLKEMKHHDALIVRSATQVTKEVLKAGQKLRVVGRAGAGVDNIDVQAATEQRIAVLNAPGANALSAAEMTITLLLNLARHVPMASSALKNGRWERAAYTGTELFGKTLAVLGLGRVGKEVALRMHYFGMNVIGYDPALTGSECNSMSVIKLELEQIWPIADYITLHTPLLPSTKHMVNADVFAKCKKGVKVINVGRGGLINEKDLLDALNKGQVSGAALDVFEEEPPTDAITLELIQHPKVIATPHLGASTKEAQVRVGTEIAEQFVNLMKPGTFDTPISAVNKVL